MKGGDFASSLNKAKKNVFIRAIFFILLACLIFYIFYEIWKAIFVEQQKGSKTCMYPHGCVLISNPKYSPPGSNSVKAHPLSVTRTESFTVSMWLYVKPQNFETGDTGMLSVIECIDSPERPKNGKIKTTSPGVFLQKGQNNLEVHMNTTSALDLPDQSCCQLSKMCTSTTASYVKCNSCFHDGKIHGCMPSGDGYKFHQLQDDHTTLHNTTSSQQPACLKPKTTVIHNIPVDRWFQLAIAVSGTNMTVYIDGKIVQTKILSSVPIVQGYDYFVMGASLPGFKGSITNLVYYQTALSSYQILDIYSKGPKPLRIDSPTKAYHKVFGRTYDTSGSSVNSS